MIRIDGTETIKNLIGNVTKDLHARKPKYKNVDYIVSIKDKFEKSTLITDESDGGFRNVSLLDFGDTNAAIGNKTGNILIGKIPQNMNPLEVVKKVQKFLTALQPENRVKSKKIISVVDKEFEDSFIRTKTIQSFTDHSISETIEGANNGGSYEVLEYYKNL